MSDDDASDASPDGRWRSLLAGVALAVGVLLLLVGGAWAADAGQRTAGPDYEFELDTEPNAGYQFTDLSPRGQNVTLAALNASANRTTLNGSDYPENYPELYDDDDFYNTSVIYVVYEYDVYQVYARLAENESGQVVVDVDRVPGAHYNVSDLSTAGQRVVQRAADDGPVRAELPPEFESSSFGGQVGQGRYYIRLQDEYAVLVVTETSPLGIDEAVRQAGLLMFFVGLVLAGSGAYVLYGRD